MINLRDKTKAEESALDEALIHAHSITIRVRLLDLDHNYIDDLTDMFDSGQVSYDADAEVTRALELNLFDPFAKINLDPDSPYKSGLYIAHMISITYVVRTPEGTTWSIPVFCGPVDKVDRDAFILKIKCLGKEVLSLSNLWRGRNFKRNQQRDWVIREILKDMVGETKMSIPNKPKKKLGKPHKLNRKTKPWKICKILAKGLGYQLFYNGAGVAVMRKTSKSKVHTFNGNWVTSEPVIGYDLSRVINAVEVTGKDPEGNRDAPKFRAVAPRNHRLSPWALGRKIKRGNDTVVVPHYLWKTIKDNGLRSKKECREVARKELDRGLIAGVEVKFSGVPHPRLEELDVVRLSIDDVTATFPMRRWTLPLVAGDDAAYGYLKRMDPGKVKRKGGKGKGKDKGKGGRNR